MDSYEFSHIVIANYYFPSADVEHHEDWIFHIGYIEKPIFTDLGILSILGVYWVYSLTHFSIAVIFNSGLSQYSACHTILCVVDKDEAMFDWISQRYGAVLKCEC